MTLIDDPEFYGNYTSSNIALSNNKIVIFNNKSLYPLNIQD